MRQVIKLAANMKIRLGIFYFGLIIKPLGYFVHKFSTTYDPVCFSVIGRQIVGLPDPDSDPLSVRIRILIWIHTGT